MSWLSCVGFAGADERSQSPVHIVLAGDSTVTDASGWGAGFARLLNDSARCTNMAKSGRSSRSFRTEGWWDKCLELKPSLLLIQFGHNDQPGKGPARESSAEGEFREHLRQYIQEARAMGVRPVLLTPLTRRRWSEQHKIEPTLAEYAKATSIVAAKEQVPLLDLNRLSIEHCNALGPEAYRVYEPMTENGADHTHLNTEGSAVVAGIVAAEFARVIPELARVINREAIPVSASSRDRQLSSSDGDLHLTETEALISIYRGNHCILVYNKNSPPVPKGIDPVYRRSGFLHPVFSPQGRTVTATFPFDHPHQHGIFSAWVRTKWNEREIDFWNLAGETGRIVHQRVVSTSTENGTIGFEVDLVHRTQQAPVVDILRERWKITARATDGMYHCFDLETTQKAITDIPLVVQKYHYGGMALRGPTRWLQGKVKEQQIGTPEKREPSSFSNDLGSDRQQGNHQKARWVTLNGQTDGKPVSITVLCHKDNFRAPQSARLHPSKPYFCFAPCVEGEFTIDRQHPLHSRFRYLVTDRTPDAAWLEQQWQLWCEH